MKQVLISFVGDQDPCSQKTQEEGSVVTLCRQLQIDEVHLMPSEELPDSYSSTEKGAYDTKEWIQECVQPGLAVNIHPLKLYHPDEPDEVLPRAKQAIDAILALQKDEEEVIYQLNVSSGTPAMKTAMFLFAASGLFPEAHVWKVANPRFVKEGEERVVELRPDFLEEASIVQRLKKNAKQFLFQSMSQDCERLSRISVHPERREISKVLARLFDAYHHWDLIQYDQARQKLSEAYRLLGTIAEAKPLRSSLQKQVDLLEKLGNTGEKESLEGLQDLQLNARRCFSRGNYTDTVARFWRVYEGSLAMRLREEHGIEPHCWKETATEQQSRMIDKFLSSPKYKAYIPRVLNRSQCHRVLGEVLKDAVFVDLMTQPVGKNKEMLLNERLEFLGRQRNFSIVAHGMRPISRKEAEDALLCMEMLVGKLLGYTEEHPLRESYISALLQILEGVLPT